MTLSEAGAGRYGLQGSVTAEDVPEIRRQVDAILRADSDNDEPRIIDLAGVVDGNSLLIGLMMGWLRLAVREEHRIRYVGTPVRLYELIEFYGLEKVLPLSTGPVDAS